MVEKRRCTARSKTTGGQCRQSPIPGGTVCHYHGGGAPQVLRKAQERLAILVDPAITRLGELVQQTEYPSTAYKACKDVLDRTGFKPIARREHSGSDGGPISIKDVEAMSDGELVARTEALFSKLKTGGA
jgi:hypothetical protein